MEQKDTTGAGKTLDRLTAWWDTKFAPEEDSEDYQQTMARLLATESQALERLRRHRDVIRYDFLRLRLADVIAIQERIVEQLGRMGSESTAAISPEAPDTFGVVLSKDLHEAHDLYNEYARLAANVVLSTIQNRFIDLAHEKERQIKILSELVPKIHN